MQDMQFILADGVSATLSPVINGDNTTSNTTAATAVTAETQAPGPAGDTAAQPASGASSIVPMILLWVAIIAVFWFFSIRPQRKKEKQLRDMQSAIKTGDDVVTSSGFFGRVVELGDSQIVVEFGTNRGIRIPVRKSDVMLAKKTEPAAKTDGADKSKDSKEIKDSGTKE